MIQSNINQTISLAGLIAQRSQWMEGLVASRNAERVEKGVSQSRQNVEEATKKREVYLTNVARNIGGTPEEVEIVRENAQLEDPKQTKTWVPYKESVANAAKMAQQAYYTNPSPQNLRRWQKYIAEAHTIQEREDITREHFEDYPRGAIGAIKDRQAEEAERRRIMIANREENRIAFARGYTFYPKNADWNW